MGIRVSRSILGDRRLQLLVVLVMLCSFGVGTARLLGGCSTLLCDEVSYWGHDYSGATPPLGSLCWDVCTDGSDSVLGANRSAVKLRAANQVGGTVKEHPWIRARVREWSVCTFGCPAYGGTQREEVTVSGTSTPHPAGWEKAYYCEVGVGS